jgi:trehalose 6-phosphate synthase
MRFFLRVFASSWLAALVVTTGFAYVEVREQRARVIHELRGQAASAADALAAAVEPLLARDDPRRFAGLLRRFTVPGRRLGVFDEAGQVIAASADLRTSSMTLVPLVSQALRERAVIAAPRTLAGWSTWVHVVPLASREPPRGVVAVVLDATDLDRVEWDLGTRTAVRIAALVLVLTGILWLVLRWSVTAPVAQMAEWTKQLRAGQTAPGPAPAPALFAPLADEVAGLARTLARARAAAAEEARLRLSGESVWTEERLKQFVQLTVGARPIFVVSNREPVSHVRDGRGVREVQPASGLVTAMEPIMLACGGVWVAHGSGTADRAVGERVPLPAAAPAYTLRRVWLDEAEENGYYYGFSNEGLWPLCHIVHERPQFRAGDWEHYRAVNQKFSNVLVREMEHAKHPIVLVQDYHFALLPQLVKRARPDARIALFWHIPWPNFEAFGICPWQEPILLGMLGADLIGFHTQFHCNNFLETVERVIEARVDWDHFAVVRGRHRTQVQPFPISVAVDPGADAHGPSGLAGLPATVIGIGVERIDYTKGLPERFLAIRRFFERWPQYRKRVTFVQIAAPSREKIESYRRLGEEIEQLARTINHELGEDGWTPIVYRARHHSHAEIREYYRAAGFCMVTSLHDGMNLVAKEFVAARGDEKGVLVLSRFAGASRELRDALLVNPYDIEDTADAIRRAVEMPVEEQRARMRRMRHWVREHNIYRWTGLLLAELGHLPQLEPSEVRG